MPLSNDSVRQRGNLSIRCGECKNYSNGDGICRRARERTHQVAIASGTDMCKTTVGRSWQFVRRGLSVNYGSYRQYHLKIDL